MPIDKEIRQKFEREIRNKMKADNVSMIDAIVDFCDKTNIEVETAAKMCLGKMRKELQADAEALNMIKTNG